jgi:hypothetical protein
LPLASRSWPRHWGVNCLRTGCCSGLRASWFASAFRGSRRRAWGVGEPTAAGQYEAAILDAVNLADSSWFRAGRLGLAGRLAWSGTFALANRRVRRVRCHEAIRHRSSVGRAAVL